MIMTTVRSTSTTVSGEMLMKGTVPAVRRGSMPDVELITQHN